MIDFFRDMASLADKFAPGASDITKCLAVQTQES
jgi:hypothetical protein